MSSREVVLIIDFGSPYNQLLTRKVRELGVYSELHPHTITKAEVEALQPKAIILSGGPYYVYDEQQYRIDPAIFHLTIPILGICYGMQLIVDHFGGQVHHVAERTYELKTITFTEQSKLNADLPLEHHVIASIGDTIESLADELIVDAIDNDENIYALSHRDKPIYGVQFYPEAEK